MNSEFLRPWRPSAGEWKRAAVMHLVRRAGFGATPEQLERGLSQGLESTLAELFEDRSDPALRQAVRPLLGAESLELLQAWWMSLILEGGAPLRERMTLVWHDLFATSNDKVDDVRLMHGQNELFRSSGLGDFRSLLHGVARDPAMLLWLDGDSNRRGHANENFAREVMELFALGIGHYTEDDIRSAGRAFTGWGTEGRAFVLRPQHHDPDSKTIFGHTGNWDGDQVIDLILEQPACARHVAQTLLEAFVAPGPEPEWIEATAALLVASDWNVGRTLETLLASELFFSPRARRARIAGPVELLAVATRTLGAHVPPKLAARLASEMGQALFRPPSVKGWDGGRSWINAGSWIARHNALVRLAQAQHEPQDGIEVDLAGAFAQPASSANLPELVTRTLLPDLEPARLAPTLARVASDASDLDRNLAATTALVLTSPEYQLF